MATRYERVTRAAVEAERESLVIGQVRSVAWPATALPAMPPGLVRSLLAVGPPESAATCGRAKQPRKKCAA